MNQGFIRQQWRQYNRRSTGFRNFFWQFFLMTSFDSLFIGMED